MPAGTARNSTSSRLIVAAGAGIALNIVGTHVSRRSWSAPATTRGAIAVNFVMTQCASLPYLVAAVALLTGGSGVLGWIAAGMIFSMIKAVSDAWVLLVEINR